MVDNSQNVMKTFSDYRDDQEMQLIQIRLFQGKIYREKLIELNLGDVLVVLIRRKDRNTVVPRGDARIQEGDVLVMNAS